MLRPPFRLIAILALGTFAATALLQPRAEAQVVIVHTDPGAPAPTPVPAPVQQLLPGWDISPDPPAMPSDWILGASGSPTPREWALTTNAALALNWDSERWDILGWEQPTSLKLERWGLYLKSYWGITGKETLLSAVSGLRNGGMRGGFRREGERLAALSTEDFLAELDRSPEAQKFRLLTVERNFKALGESGILAWDLCRIIQITGRAALLGYVTQDEAWEIVMPVARELQAGYDSWESMGRAYIAGREYWTIQEVRRTGRKFRAIQAQMLADPKSPYNTIPWNLNLGDKP